MRIDERSIYQQCDADVRNSLQLSRVGVASVWSMAQPAVQVDYLLELPYFRNPAVPVRDLIPDLDEVHQSFGGVGAAHEAHGEVGAVHNSP